MKLLLIESFDIVWISINWAWHVNVRWKMNPLVWLLLISGQMCSWAQEHDECWWMLGFSVSRTRLILSSVLCMRFHVYAHALVHVYPAWRIDWMRTHSLATWTLMKRCVSLGNAPLSKLHSVRSLVETNPKMPFHFISFSHAMFIHVFLFFTHFQNS